MALTPQEHTALALLEEWHRRLDDIMALIEKRRSTKEIHGAYAAVKLGIESEYRTRHLAREPQHEATERLLESTFQKAFVHLSTPGNAPTERIYELVYEASSDLSHVISDMRAKRDADAT